MHGEVVKVPGHIDGTNENAIVTLCLGNSATFKCCARPYNRGYGKEAALPNASITATSSCGAGGDVELERI